MGGLLRRHYGAAKVAAGEVAAPIRLAFERYFAGHRMALKAVPWRTGGTEFQRKVWKALTSIPVGETWSYAQLAAAIGKPKAVRAVGLANGANPDPDRGPLPPRDRRPTAPSPASAAAWTASAGCCATKARRSTKQPAHGKRRQWSDASSGGQRPRVRSMLTTALIGLEKSKDERTFTNLSSNCRTPL